MKVDQNFQPVLLCPAKRLVKLLNAADERLPVPKNKIGNRNADRIQANPADRGEIPLRDIFASMDPDPRLIDLMRQLQRKVLLILRIRAFKKRGTHPFFQNEPVSKINSFYIHSRLTSSVIFL